MLREADYELPEGVSLMGLTAKTEKLKIGDIFVKLTTGTLLKKDHAEIKKWVLSVMKSVGGLRANQCRKVKISIFQTNYEKKLNAPTKTLGEFQVNSGYSYALESIVIYREEDWKKVFIHECFHLFGFDDLAEGFVGDQFPIPTPVDLKEVFSETNARILYAWWTWKPPGKEKDFWSSQHLQKQVEFSLLQMVKVLDHFELTFKDVASRKHLERFKETSNVFAYYVVTAILMKEARNYWKLALALLNGKKVDFPEFIRSATKTMNGSASLLKAEDDFRRTPTPSLKMVGGNCLTSKKWKRTSTVTKSSSTRRRLKKSRSRAS